MIAFDVLMQKACSPDRMCKVNLFETGYLFCDVYCLLPGQAQKPHSHAEADKIYYVIEGKGTFRIGNEERVLSSGMIVLAPSATEHGVKNESDTDLVLLVLMAPNPNVNGAN